MKFAWPAVFCVAVCASHTTAAQGAPDAAVQNQWFTGTLEAPSPALPKAGLLAFEPYVIYMANGGAYGTGGGIHSVPNEVTDLESVVVLKYGITDRVSIEALPSVAHAFNDQSTYTGIGDLPVEFEYRFNNENNKTGLPSVTAAVGMTFPTGAYDGLHAPLDGLGNGTYTAKEGLLFQSLFDTWGHHPLRLRAYGNVFEPVADVPVRNLSIYGTGLGFRGQAAPGVMADAGLGAAYGLNQRLVLALDLIQHYADRLSVTGTNATGIAVHTIGPSSSSFAAAPAMEYNWSGTVGIIFGIEFSAAGRNTGSYVAPQVALSTAFF